MSHRRTVLATIGGLVTGSIAISTLSKTATAQVTNQGLSIPNREYAQTEKLQDVRIKINADYSFDAEQVPDRWILSLSVSDDGINYEQIDERRMAPSSDSNSGTEELSGSIVQTGKFAIQQFQLESGDSQTSVPIFTKLTFTVEIGSAEIAKVETTDQTSLTVTPGQVEASSNLSGSGEIVISK